MDPRRSTSYRTAPAPSPPLRKLACREMRRMSEIKPAGTIATTSAAETARLRRLRPLAVLPVQMPLLRLQQPCAAKRSIRQPMRRRCARELAASGAAGPGQNVSQHFLRRRHAVADAAADDRGDPRGDRRAAGELRAERRDHAGGQSDQRRGGTISRLTAPPASTASRSASSRFATTTLKKLGRLHTAAEALERARHRASDISRASRFDLIYARPGQTLDEWRDELRRGAVARRRSISRSTS